MTPEERKVLVESKIDVLIQEFNSHPDKFLTEEDLRSYLYHLLLTDFNELEDTEDNSKSISLHCEVRWYGEDQDLTLRSDIVIFDVSKLITQKSTRLPSKGYGFNNPHIIIELKLRRVRGDSSNKYQALLIADRERLSKIKRKVSESGANIYTYLIGFDKKANINFQVENNEFQKEFYIFNRFEEGQNGTPN